MKRSEWCLGGWARAQQLEAGEVRMARGLVARTNNHEEKLLFGLCHDPVSHSLWPEPVPIFHIARVGDAAPTLVPRSARGRQLVLLPRAATAG